MAYYMDEWLSDKCRFQIINVCFRQKTSCFDSLISLCMKGMFDGPRYDNVKLFAVVAAQRDNFGRPNNL